MLNDHPLVVIGQLSGPHGIKGWLKVRSYAEKKATIFDYQPWLVKQEGGEWQTLHYEDKRCAGKKLLVKLPDCDSTEDAARYQSADIGIYRQQMPVLKKNEYYWTDLIGLHVVNQHGQPLGKVIRLIATGANDVLVIEGEQHYLIPFLFGHFIIEVNLETQKIQVNWEVETT